LFKVVILFLVFDGCWWLVAKQNFLTLSVVWVCTWYSQNHLYKYPFTTVTWFWFFFFRKQGVLILHVMCITQSVLRNHSIDRLICFALRRIHGILAKFKTRTSKKKNQNQVTVVKGYLYRWFCEYQVQTQTTDKVRKFCCSCLEFS
jgi:hypothetical protein